MPRRARLDAPGILILKLDIYGHNGHYDHK